MWIPRLLSVNDNIIYDISKTLCHAESFFCSADCISISYYINFRCLVEYCEYNQMTHSVWTVLTKYLKYLSQYKYNQTKKQKHNKHNRMMHSVWIPPPLSSCRPSFDTTTFSFFSGNICLLENHQHFIVYRVQNNTFNLSLTCHKDPYMFLATSNHFKVLKRHISRIIATMSSVLKGNKNKQIQHKFSAPTCFESLFICGGSHISSGDFKTHRDNWRVGCLKVWYFFCRLFHIWSHVRSITAYMNPVVSNVKSFHI